LQPNKNKTEQLVTSNKMAFLNFLLVAEQLMIETNDVIATVESISPTVKPQLNQKYLNWDSQYGAT